MGVNFIKIINIILKNPKIAQKNRRGAEKYALPFFIRPYLVTTVTLIVLIPLLKWVGWIPSHETSSTPFSPLNKG